MERVGTRRKEGNYSLKRKKKRALHGRAICGTLLQKLSTSRKDSQKIKSKQDALTMEGSGTLNTKRCQRKGLFTLNSRGGQAKEVPPKIGTKGLIGGG